jgi:hypothetical protein
MANFPALTPVGRKYNTGVFTNTLESGFSGGSIRFLHSNIKTGITLELSYFNLSQAESKEIRDHYRGEDGGHRSFLLPAAIWAGQSNVANIATTNTRWKYTAPPEENHKSGGLVDLAVSLVSVRF